MALQGHERLSEWHEVELTQMRVQMQTHSKHTQDACEMQLQMLRIRRV